MRYEDVVSNVNVYGFEEAVKGAKYSYAIDTNAVTSEVTKTTLSLANSKAGSGHDQFMTGIIVQFDLTFSNKAWVEAERYKFLNFISSQSTMHRITKFDLDQAYLPYVDNRIVEIMKEKVKAYNELQAQMTSFKNEGKDVSEMMNTLNEMYLEILYSNPA